MSVQGERAPRLAVLIVLSACLMPAVAGCGDVAGDAVAEVDGKAIEMRSFNHWLAVTARTSGGPKAAIPKPPDYTACVAQKRATQGAGEPTATDVQLKQQCRQQYDTLRDQTLQLLISYRWIEEEAADRKISVTDAEVKQSFDEQRKRSFPRNADFLKFLEDSGQTEQDILMRVRADLLSSKIRDQVTRQDTRFSDDQVADYYRMNKTRFAHPERRDFRVVLAESGADAVRAIAALRAGGSWNSVAARYSIDEASKSQGGELRDIAKGRQEKAFDDALFKAPKGRISGPVKTRLGHYVFKVTKVTPPSQQTLEQAEPTIRQMLASESSQKSLDDFVETFQRKWKEKTECVEPYAIPDCKNGPKATPAPTS